MQGDKVAERIRSALPALEESEVLQLSCVVKRIVAELSPEFIFVFGSHARGEATVDSDIDLLLVVPTSQEPTYRLAQAAYRAAFPYTSSLDILVMTREEFERRSRAVTSLSATVLREGQMLYAA